VIRILLVEDESKVARAVSDGLEAEGYEVTLTAMVDSLLLLSRADAGEGDLRPAPMSLDELASEVAADLTVLAEEKRQEVRVEAPAGVTVVADRPAVLEVIDNGPGIAPEHLPHVFERFYRADRARSRASGSAGLGLSIAAWAIESNGGRIEVESEVSRGSVFRIVLAAAS
jgi:signal transduction histidine kinase